MATAARPRRAAAPNRNIFSVLQGLVETSDEDGQKIDFGGVGEPLGS